MKNSGGLSGSQSRIRGLDSIDVREDLCVFQ